MNTYSKSSSNNAKKDKVIRVNLHQNKKCLDEVCSNDFELLFFFTENHITHDSNKIKINWNIVRV